MLANGLEFIESQRLDIGQQRGRAGGTRIGGDMNLGRIVLVNRHCGNLDPGDVRYDHAVARARPDVMRDSEGIAGYRFLGLHPEGTPPHQGEDMHHAVAFP